MKFPTLLFLLAAAPLFAQDAPAPAATPAEQVTVPPGFKIELLRSAAKSEGSWVSMAIDEKGRLYISPQGAPPEAGFKKDNQWGGLWRVTLDAQGHVAQWEKVPVPVGDAMGMLWAFDSLYVSGSGPDGRAIYRLQDTNGDDTLDAAKLWKAVPGGNGEHGAHALVLGPDGKSIYIAHGNSTPLVDGIDAQSPYRNYAEDILIPRVMDPVATFFDKLKTPYGQVLRTDENGTRWELFAGGFRNEYDIDFNADGELFTYDSDMEWDVGLPWYRPTRVLHIIPGAEFGFREGNQKWPEYYPDSLPAVTNIGLGCPTGVKFGTKSNFPERYKRAFFIMDWTFGRLLAVQTHPDGASYSAQNPIKSYTHPTGPEASEDVEVFLSGKGMPLTDLEFGKDGAMYFTVGGRGTQAGLYRVSWAGKELEPALAEDRGRDEGIAARESVARMKDHASSRYAVDEAWQRLGSPDRFTSFPARLMIEDMSVGAWGEKALAETEPRTALTALLALARVGAKEQQAPLLKALGKFPLESLDDDLKLVELRAIKLSFARQGRPDTDLVNAAIEKLGQQYPAAAWPLNRELCELLVWLGAPDAIEKTLGLLEASTSPEEQTWYACMLRETQGWTPAQRERYFAWFPTGRSHFGGNSRKKFVEKIQELALAKVPEAERAHFAEIASKTPEGKVTQPAIIRQYQKAWTMADLESDLPKAASGRNFARGKEIFASVQCATCHLFNGGGGNVGPDLTAVGGRFQRRDILESILEPSKVISEQYASFVFTLKNGEIYVGQVATESNYHYEVIIDAIRGERRQIAKTSLKSKELNPVSLMPPGLINVLTKDEILDLLAYLESGGNEKAKAFAK
jgi:putative heme-binding domain-containing protein